MLLTEGNNLIIYFHILRIYRLLGLKYECKVIHCMYILEAVSIDTHYYIASSASKTLSIFHTFSLLLLPL
jgi:hypothetical protein